MKPDRPRIGVSGPERGAWPSWFCLRILIWLAGGKAIQITPLRPLPKEPLDGLILGGGADIDPVLYKEKVIQTFREHSRGVNQWSSRMIFSVLVWLCRKIFSLEYTTQSEDKARDKLEFSLLKKALNEEWPVLGICRGAQLINVYFGGSLYQDISHFYVEQPQLHSILPRSTIAIEPFSRLFGILKRHYTRVNSLHHQSIKKLGQGLRVVASEKNGLVEAIEHMEKKFVIGVQWHPEFQPFHSPQRELLKSLVEEARTQKISQKFALKSEQSVLC